MRDQSAAIFISEQGAATVQRGIMFCTGQMPYVSPCRRYGELTGYTLKINGVALTNDEVSPYIDNGS